MGGGGRGFVCLFGVFGLKGWLVNWLGFCLLLMGVVLVVCVFALFCFVLLLLLLLLLLFVCFVLF